MRALNRHLALLLVTAGLLHGCATRAAPDPTAEVPYCHKSNKGRISTCTREAAPSLNADAEAKRFLPDPDALTLYVVRRNRGDGRRVIAVRADGGPSAETLPATLVRMRLHPGRHTITFELEGQSESTTVEGTAGEVRFVRINSVVWPWARTVEWSSEAQAAIRERALTARLVADLVVR